MRVDQQGWQPGENTVAYYEFDNDLNDSSGNGYNLSLYGGSVTYGTTADGAKYGYFNTSTWTSSMNVNIDFSNTDGFTVNLWVNPQSDLYQQYPKTMYEIQDLFRLYGTIDLFVQGSGQSSVSDDYQISTNTWSLITLTYDKANTLFECYVNGVKVFDLTNILTGGSKVMRINQVWDTNRSNYSNDAYYSELILENKLWTAQEVADYYNQTKSLYGIS